MEIIFLGFLFAGHEHRTACNHDEHDRADEKCCLVAVQGRCFEEVGAVFCRLALDPGDGRCRWSRVASSSVSNDLGLQMLGVFGNF